VVYVSARWTGPADVRDAPLSPYADTVHRQTVEKLDAALLHPDGPPVSAALREGIQRSVAKDVADLLPSLHARARGLAEAARLLLERRAESEARQMEGLLTAQRERIERSLAEHAEKADDGQLTLSFPEGLNGEERRQWEADHQHWKRRLASLDGELRAEPARIREGYAVTATRVEPVGVIYLVPAGG
jgi:hypothetical protein